MTSILHQTYAEIDESRKATGRTAAPDPFALIKIVTDTFKNGRGAGYTLTTKTDEHILTKLYDHPTVSAARKAGHWDPIDEMHVDKLLMAAMHGALDAALAKAEEEVHYLKKLKVQNRTRKRLQK
jgi:hypothetical protein